MAEFAVVARRAIASTAAVQRALADARDHTSRADLLFLERWEQAPIPGAAAAMRINQIRRANPALAAELRAELLRGRPLTNEERAAVEQAAIAAAALGNGGSLPGSSGMAGRRPAAAPR